MPEFEGKFAKEIMVVSRQFLFRGEEFQGFRPAREVDYEKIIVGEHTYMIRGAAENNPGFKQPIAYSMIVNKDLKTVFAFKRASRDKDYVESRLQGKWSWGVGGHIERCDIATGENVIIKSRLRELGEEVDIQGSVEPRVLGYINDETNPVGQVHFGVLYAIVTDARVVEPKDPEIAKGKMEDIGQLEILIATPEVTVENWSQIAFEPLKDFVGVS